MMTTVSTSGINGFTLIFILAIASTFAPLSIDFFAPSMPHATQDLAASASAIQPTLYSLALVPFATP